MSKTTDIICILDRSGSMGGSEQDVIGSFNSFIAEQKKIKGKARVTLVLFDDYYDVVLDRVKLNKVQPITTKDYFVRGLTALNDAIGKTISNIDNTKAICMIQTDGGENASKEYTSDVVRQLVDKKTKQGWEFMFIGTDLDKFTANNIAKNYNIHASQTVVFSKSAEDYDEYTRTLNIATTACRAA